MLTLMMLIRFCHYDADAAIADARHAAMSAVAAAAADAAAMPCHDAMLPPAPGHAAFDARWRCC